MIAEPPVSKTAIAYAPSALLQLFSNALIPATMKDMILMKGNYVPGRGSNYNGFYYDVLKDEATDAQVTLIVPALLRTELEAGKAIEFWAYVTKRVVAVGGRIEIHVNLSQLMAQEQARFSDKELRAMQIQQRKSSAGYRDVDGFIKAKIVRQERVSVTILIGRAAIIDADIRHAIQEAIGFFDLRFERINMASEGSIDEALARFSDTGLNDLLVLSRGGGENMEVFESPEVAACCVDLEPLFLTAIGHKENVSLVQRVADKAFITPTALGEYLRAIYNDTVAEMENSKAMLVERITGQLKASYDGQVKNLQERIRAMEEMDGKGEALRQQELAALRKQLENLQVQQSEKELMLARTRELSEEYRLRAERLALMVQEVRSGADEWMKWLVLTVIAVVAGLLGWWLGRR